LTQGPTRWYFKFMRSLRDTAGALFLCVGLLLAVQGSSWGASKYAGEFLSLGVGARPMGMGGAYAAISDDASAIYWNAAGLTNLSRRQVLFMHAESFGGLVGHDYLGFVLPLEPSQSAVGIGLLRLGVKDIPYTKLDTLSQRPYVWKRVNDAEYALFFSYARRGGESWSLGGSAKLIRKGVGDDYALGLGADVGVLYRLRSRWAMGAKLADITSTPLAWNSGHREYILPMLKLGTVYGLAPKFLRGEVLLALDVDTRFEGRDYSAWASLGGVSMDPRAGIEYRYRRLVALRVGMQPGQFSAGAGIRLGLGGVDYAFLGHDELDNSHRLSALVEF
jgi:hypothetical protein